MRPKFKGQISLPSPTAQVCFYLSYTQGKALVPALYRSFLSDSQLESFISCLLHPCGSEQKFKVTNAAVRNLWSESNTEPHIENITFGQNQVNSSTVASKEDVMDQTPGKSHAPSDAAGNFTSQTETADAGGRNDPLRRINVTIFPVGPKIATALTSQSSTLAFGRRHLPSSSAESEGGGAPSHTESGTSQGSLAKGDRRPEEVTVHTHVATSVLSQSSLPALGMGEETTLSRKRNSSEVELPWLHFSRTSAYSSTSDHSTASRSIEELSNSTALQSSSVRETKSVHVATTFPSGIPRRIQSISVSLGPLNETESFPEDSKITTTSVSVRSSPSEAELRRNSGIIRNPGNRNFMEPSSENRFGLPSSETSVRFWQNDSPISEGPQLGSSSNAENGHPMSQTGTMSGSVPSVRDGASTAHWFLTDSKTFADVTGTATYYPEVVNSSVLTQFSASAPQSRRSDTTLGERSSSEPATESLASSSSESLESLAPRGERLTTEDSPEPGVSADMQKGSKGTSGVGAHTPHTSATITGNGERTLRSLTNRNSTSGDVGHSAPVPRETGSTPPHGAGDDAQLGSKPPAASRALGVTGTSSDQVSGTDIEQRTSGNHMDHTYVSSTFTKGERALLSITDNSSSADIRESSTSSVRISNSSQSDHSSSSQVKTERSSISSYGREFAQPSTESLGLRTATSVGGSSSPSSGPPVPLPSASQSHQFSSTLLSTRASAHPLESTPDVPSRLSSSPPPLPASLTVSTPASLSVSQTTLSPSSSTLVLPRARDTPVIAARTSTVASSVTMLSGSQTADPKNQSNPHHEKIATESKPPSLESLPTEAIEAEPRSSISGTPLPPALTEFSTEQTLLATSTSLAQTPPASRDTTLKTSHPLVPTLSPPSSTTTPKADPTTVQTMTRKQLLSTDPQILVPLISTEGAVTTKRNQVHIEDTTQSISLTTVPTSAKVLTTGLGISEEYSPDSHFLRTSPSPQTTDVSTAEVLTPKPITFPAQSSTPSPTALSSPASVNSCATNPCLHDGKCIVDPTSHGYRCMCSPSWQGDDCSVDVNECLSNPCPPLAVCNNTQGSFTCRCPVGYQLEKGICNLVRTFVTEFKLKKIILNATMEKHSDLHEVENEIIKTLNVCFSTLPGYIRSTVRASKESSTVVMSLQTTFSLASNVTLFDLADRMQKCVNSCRSSAEVCQLLGSQRKIFRAGSLCKRKTPECDKETSICTDLDGVALCQCKSGYFQFNKMDHSCRACEDGYRLENETCMSCPFGLGGLNCGNPYQLITVVIAAAGGGLLLILGTALIVTCCRKNKNDISKLIFKSGEFQMSPYAEYPKNPRSQEWGREAIEMHENGSTKNLLQMTDVYYSPTSVRNPELERNGLYPAYTGLPGSRHSCIFPGQYNPSFISDESRRRDYF
ncbi:protein HEG homolog 1 isoform X3 [Rousettus aegyptiacus]|uniref:protein HEG homolog 1 isoform X3 n=1 Tax=Rousettus aegyptiacus TaxID=9407 RepID=UPI00168D86DE|nr:protein HEG homolog 1 isoform X3 [Rousettus aegyptiacus]